VEWGFLACAANPPLCLEDVLLLLQLFFFPLMLSVCIQPPSSEWQSLPLAVKDEQKQIIS